MGGEKMSLEVCFVVAGQGSDDSEWGAGGREKQGMRHRRGWWVCGQNNDTEGELCGA